MNLVNLDNETRKKVYELLDIEEFKKFVKDDFMTQNRFRFAVRTRIDTFTKQNLVTYLENIIQNNDLKNPIYDWSIMLIEKSFASKCKATKKIHELVENITYNEYESNSQINYQLEKYRDEYQICSFPISYEEFILFCCKTSEKTKNKMIQIAQDSKLEEAENKIKELNNEISDLKDTHKQKNKELNDTIKTLRAELRDEKEKQKDLQKEIQKYQKLISEDNMIIMLKDLINVENKRVTYDQIINLLNNKETELMESEEYKQVLQVLAAKYEIIKVMKEM